ncbi:MAG: cysteine desulfurase family protein [Deltaproteobacteria bacterium]
MPIYLDHNASAPVRPEARAAREACPPVGNASSVHWAGRALRHLLDEARERVAALLGCEPGELVFTSGGSEGNALALWGAFLGRADRSPRRGVAVSSIEHPSVLKTAEALRAVGALPRLLPVDPQGLVCDESFDADTALASVMLANNETGVLQPVQDLAARARALGALFHCDAVQAAGRLPVRPRELGVDLLTLSGHKLGAGPGAGVLYVRDGVRLRPLAAGHQEDGRRAGTEDVAAILALAAAFEAAEREREAEAERQLALRLRLEEGLCRLPGAFVVGARAPRLSNTVSACLPGASGEGMLIALDLAGIAASSGAACASGTLEPSHVLLAMGLEPAVARSALRFSLGRETTAAELDALLSLLPDIVLRSREAEREG